MSAIVIIPDPLAALKRAVANPPAPIGIFDGQKQKQELEHACRVIGIQRSIMERQAKRITAQRAKIRICFAQLRELGINPNQLCPRR